MQLEIEHLRGPCKDIAALTEQRDKLILQRKRQAGDTKVVDVWDALETNDIRGQCRDAATVKEQLNIVTVQRPKLRKGRTALVIVTMLVL
jgi:hypothetical protein